MSILDVTEEQVFHTLGRGRDPNFKPVEKLRPVNKPEEDRPTRDPAKPAPLRSPGTQHSEVDDSIMKLAENLIELNNRMNNIQKMVVWYTMPQYLLVVVILAILFVKM